ncbi:15674_t:CDS:1, partial [Gigaspora margarita]
IYYVTVSEVTIQVNTIIKSITTNFIGTIMNQNNILSNDLTLFIQKFAINIVTNIKLRFTDHEFINSFRIFDPKQLTTDCYSIQFIEIIKLEIFMELLKRSQ